VLDKTQKTDNLQNMKRNITLTQDSYKISQWKAYNPEMANMFSYLESRGGPSDSVLFFGLQYYLKEYLAGQVVTQQDIEEADAFCKAHFGRDDVFNRYGWEYILKEHGGRLPLVIHAIPEGSRVPVKNVLMTIEATDEKCAWLVNYVETLLLKVWYSITILTRSNGIYKDIAAALEKSGDIAGLPFKCHDFGYRGCTSEEQAAIGGAAHLASGFAGSDTIAGVLMANKYYRAAMSGFSIPATEHSVICSFGEGGEEKAFSHFLGQYGGLRACVSDTYNIFDACEQLWGGAFRDQLKVEGNTLVVRPDSGDYMEVVPEILDILWNSFGGTVNSKGYKVLNPCVRVIQGDSMNPKTIKALYDKIMELGWSADNLAVGSGGGLLQENAVRDLYKFKIAASAVKLRSGIWIDSFKDPITDKGKMSKRGRLKLVIGDNGYETVREEDPRQNQLVEVFRDGVLTKEWTFDEVKARANS
jgi:nicotinamide phosphoribosyltransferase